MKTSQRALPRMAEFDAMCAAYQEAEATRDRLWQQLWTASRRFGTALKVAPRSRLLAGVEFEALASLATRTEVDQKRAAQLEKRLGVVPFFEKQMIYSLRSDWERIICTIPAHPSANVRRRAELLRRAIQMCLRTRPVKRLTVRKRKSSPQSARSPQRRAA